MCPPGEGIARHLLCFSRIRSRMLSMQRARPWFVGPATHGARATQLFSRSRAHSRERARCAHTGAQQIDAQRSRLIAHSLSRLECRLPLMANTPLGHCACAPSGSVHPSEGVNGNPQRISLPQRRSRSIHLASSVASPHRTTSNGGSCCKQRGCRTVLQATMARATSNEAAAPCYKQRWLVLQATRLPI